MSIDDDIDCLLRVPMLALLGDAALRILAIGAESRMLQADDVLYRAGEPADAGYAVQDGAIGLQSPDGTIQHVMRPGMLLGEYALLTETKRMFTAAAMEPSVVIRISRNLFVRMLESYPEAALKMRDAMAGRAMQSTREMEAVRAALLGRMKPR